MDWTGLNTEQVKIDGQVFLEQLAEINKQVAEAFGDFASSLYTNWASPIAKEISKKWNEEMKEFEVLANDFLSETREKLMAAINQVMNANGLGNIFFDIFNPIKINIPEGAFLEEKDATGAVGMKVKNVQNVVIPTLEGKLKDAITRYGELPGTLSLYDESGAQQEAFETKSREVRIKLTKVLEDIENDIKEKSSTEFDNVLLAVQKSTNTLNA